MPYAVLAGDRTVLQYGDDPGGREGHAVEEVSEETITRIRAAIAGGHGGGVTLSPGHATILPNPEPAHRRAMLEVDAARARQRADDLRTLCEHEAIPDDLRAALARLVG